MLCSIFQHVSIIQYLFSTESYFDSRIATQFFYIFFFFQEQTLGDISFKLETKIMNFMSVFFEKKNIIKSTQVLSIICNTICLQFSLYPAPLQSLGLFLLISSTVFPILSVFLTKYHYIILTDYPGIQFHRYIS